MREIFASQGMGSQGPKYAHFGLADAWGGNSATYTVKVRFTGGDVKVVSNVVPSAATLNVGGAIIPQMIRVEQNPAL
jgi:hypothetical protein